MRIFSDFKEALNEIRRDLAEMGITVHPQTMQDKYVADNPEYCTQELQNYTYTVVSAANSLGSLSPTQPWADAELAERISGQPLNPGEAYLHRREVWDEFLHNGRFAYSYPERLAPQLAVFIEEIKKNPNSRQLFLSMWNPSIDPNNLGGVSRVPCSLGYLFQLRDSKLNMTYFMRSCDFVTHFQNDAYLAVGLQKFVARQTGYEPGNFTHFMGSLHVYKKDIQGVF